MKLGIIISIALTAGACGHDKNMAEPRLIGGGGVGDGAIAGRVNVFAIDGDTDSPVGGATIYLGEPGEDPLEALTDSSGLATVDDDILEGPTTITVVADGYVPSTWFGADGANVTVPLTPIDEPTDIPQATLSGTIDGWNDLPAPETNHFYYAAVGYSQTDDLGDPANELAQANGGNGLQANVCILSDFLTECDFDVNVRTGTIAVFAPIIDLDTKGTFEDDSDDTFEVIGLAYQLDVEVDDGVDQSGLVLDPIEIGAMTDVQAIVPDLPSGLEDVGVVMGLNTADNGILMLAFANDPDDAVLTVPKLEGDFAGASYRAIAFAGNAEDDGDDTAPSSTILLRGITNLDGDLDLGDWLALPTDVDLASGEYSFSPVEGAALHTAEVVNTIGDTKWNIALLDGRTSFTLPSLDPDPVPSTFDLSVSALEGPLDVTDFAIDDVIDSIDRMSRNRERVSR